MSDATMADEACDMVELWPARDPALPLVCDSPHCGSVYPADFGTRQPLVRLRRVEDSHVAKLWSAAPAFGATLLAARFPRSYCDVNRELDDLDPALLDGPWPTPLHPSGKSALGYGLIWRQLAPSQPLYDRPLTVAAVQRRIESCWRPYRTRLLELVDAARRDHGLVWHLNLHSMPQESGPVADVVLGDRDGASCAPALTALVERAFRAAGLSVARNEPYKGAALVAWIGRPAEGRHSLQIELRRGLYMDERTRTPHGGFAPLQQALGEVLGVVADALRAQDLSPR